MAEYRQMQATDISACAAIEAFAPDPWTEAQLRETDSTDISHSFVAIESCAVVAFCSMQAIDGEISLNAVTVLPDYRKRGIARGLLCYAFSVLNASEVYLEVREGNSGAIALYKSMGFINVGLRRDFYCRPRENAIIMALKKGVLHY